MNYCAGKPERKGTASANKHRKDAAHKDRPMTETGKRRSKAIRYEYDGAESGSNLNKKGRETSRSRPESDEGYGEHSNK
jgi:hypothetical protein